MGSCQTGSWSAMTRRIPTLKTLGNLAKEVREALDNEEFDIVASLLWDVAFKAILFAMRRQGYQFRRTWPHMKPLVPALVPLLSTDYTKVLEQAKNLDKDTRYAEDD